MTSRDFCYWLQGYLEIATAGERVESTAIMLNPTQLEMVKRHLAMVFKHEIDPSIDNGNAMHGDVLNAIHGPPIIDGLGGTPGPVGQSGQIFRC